MLLSPTTKSYSETALSRLELMFGARGIEVLRSATVVVFGVGGVGSNCVEALARGGVGHLVLIDGDEVVPSNINRQAIAFYSTIGQRKVEVMRDFIAQINPDTQVSVYDQFVLPEDVKRLLSEWKDASYIIDAIDTVASKLEIARCAYEQKLPLISSMGGGRKLRPECFSIADLYETKNDPLCRIMRKEARKRGIPSLKVLYSCEEAAELPLFPDDEVSQSAFESGSVKEVVSTSLRTKAPLGTVSYIPPIMGHMIAGFVIQELLGVRHD